jgi:hypothetical protein
MKVVQPIDINNSVFDYSNVAENDYADWNNGITYLKEERVNYVDPSSVVTITIAFPAIVTWIDHGFSDGQVILFSTTGDLPTGLISGIAYYILSKTTNTFQISETSDGASIVTTGSQNGVHTGTASIHLVFESLKDFNLNNIPLSSNTHWLKVSSTNRWRMLDSSISSRTSNLDTVDVVLNIFGRINAVAMLNLRAASVRVIMTNGTEGVVYDRSENLSSTVGINNWYSWYFSPIVRQRGILFSDLPTYQDTELNVIITDIDNMAEIGALVVGNSTLFGVTQYGMNVGIIDFSIKQRDTFGNISVIERGFSRRTSLTVWAENSLVDEIVNVLSDIRAKPAVYEGSEQFGSSLVYGFYRDFDVAVEMPTASLLDITIEGLI